MQHEGDARRRPGPELSRAELVEEPEPSGEVGGTSTGTERGSRATRWFFRALVCSAAILALGYTVHFSGLLRFRSEVKRLEAEHDRPARPAVVDPGKNAALPLQELVERVEDGALQLEPGPEEVVDEGLAAILADYARWREDERIEYVHAVALARDEVLHEGELSPEPWAVVASWLPRLQPVFVDVERICQRPEWSFDGAEEPEVLAILRAHGRREALEILVSWLGVAALDEARKGHAAAALQRLEQGFQLAEASRAVPRSADFARYAGDLASALDGLQQVLRWIPAEQDLSAIARIIARTNATAELDRAVLGELHVCLDLYRERKVSELMLGTLYMGLDAPAELPPIGRGLALVYPLLVGHDAAEFARLGAQVLDGLDGSLADLLRSYGRGRRTPGPWHAPLASFVTLRLTAGIAACIDLESRIRLARIALVDREQGRAAALESADRCIDPAVDRPIGVRSEDDGSVTLWCIGSDLEDRDGGYDDIVWILPPQP